jgi:hypothetical protein
MHLSRLVALLCVVVGGVGCGLPDSFFLQPPVVNTQATPLNPVFRIVGTDRGADTGATFQGYELYYKFYGLDSETSSDATSYGTGSTNTDLIQGGFHRLCLGTSLSGLTADTTAGFASAPLVNIAQLDQANIGQSYTVEIRLNDLSIPVPPAPPTGLAGSLSYYIYIPPGAPAATSYEEVRRFVNLPTGTGCKTFGSALISGVANNYAPGADVDLSGTVWARVPGNNGYIFVMIYALSYGKSIVDGTPIYSSPVSLGYTKILVN